MESTPSLHLTHSVFTEVREWRACADLLAASFEKIHGSALAFERGGVELCYDSVLADNAYRIESDTAFRVYASAAEGLRYGIATALQLLDSKNGALRAPKGAIEDRPDKDFRGLMIDIARRFHEPRSIFKIIDLCFFYKIKYLHLHLMDDQSYNLPSKEFPRLPTEKKSYSFEEVAEFNRYAQSRGVILVPELEIPGHASIFNEAYPELFMNHPEKNVDGMFTENGDPIDSKSVICVGSKKAEEALSRLLAELCELFPHTPYIHIGGDEADSNHWDSCTVCKNYMKEHGISDVGELYCDFTARIASLVLKNGRTPIVWEGFPKKGAERIPKETIVIAWESYYHTASDLIEEGFRIINASWQPLYIVGSLVRRWYAKDILSWDVYNLQHWWEKSLASKNQIHLSPTDQVLGAQICSWGCSFEQEIGLLLENLAALSERTWNTDGKIEMTETLEAMEPLLSRASRFIQ